jgi:predicted NAD/FAD-binding protein
MLADLVRFYRIAPRLLDGVDDGPTLGEFLAEHRFGATFRDEHLVPMASALWSSPPDRILAFPARYLARFMANHQMLQLGGRPQWRVVVGGSNAYVRAMRRAWRVDVRTGAPVERVRRDAEGVEVFAAGSVDRFDQIVLACHSDDALALLADANASEREVLGAIPYQCNDVVLHTDASLLPRNRKAWAAWNAHVPREPGAACTVSYCMNLLQGIESPQPLVVSLNRTAAIDPARILRRLQYRHPVYTLASVAAQARRPELQGLRRTWFAGAYWGWGFHEDGMRSAVDVARALGVHWHAPARAANDVQSITSPAWSRA